MIAYNLMTLYKKNVVINIVKSQLIEEHKKYMQNGCTIIENHLRVNV